MFTLRFAGGTKLTFTPSSRIRPGWVFEAGDHAQHRRLAAAARSQQRKELPSRDLERHLVDGPQPSEDLRHAVEGDRAGAAEW